MVVVVVQKQREGKEEVAIRRVNLCHPLQDASPRIRCESLHRLWLLRLGIWRAACQSASVWTLSLN